MNEPIDFDQYIPSAEQMAQAEELRDLLLECRQKNVRISLVGGYGLDAMYGRLTRDHKDFDFLIEAGRSRDTFVEMVTQRGYVALPEQFDPRRGKEAYHLFAKGYQAEFGALDDALLENLAHRYQFRANLSQFIPVEPAGRLFDLPVCVPTREGLDIFDHIQQATASEKGWAGYKHTQHNARLMVALKNRL